MRLLADHTLLFQVAAAVLAMTLSLSLLWISLRGQQSNYRAKHHSPRRSRERGHQPRHAVSERHARHVAVAPAPSASIDHERTRDLVGVV